ncbi:citramalate synthase [Planktothrix agardhii]|jgi:2-isopropylmalate synthase|uniref:Citramalate synthase n=1 Tax=Planktothrix agardhii TaxID=1160 RepID=A0AAD1V3P1_PLAAG|nr:citramalate synthase [Planktothrix agardhii]MBG0748763.1 citramalate synthase [Planktothrix agardhii KL2]MCB8767070.1 citramalate synthase [Planktothrix agardhii 1809]MCB8776188.1 citramalate synthase [Planktothrix agardhii 1031]MCB8780613.1 citramalate synthase [Planktothrix agardhii 1808]MCF3568198.1 citramalate synthase [Planktothrix agardhii 1807]
MTHPLWIYDTTLRDGAQREGLSLSLDDKLRIVRQLDSLGIPFIEGGWPGANPKDVQFFWKLQEQPLVNSEVVAFCSTRRPNSNAAEDDNLKAILSAGTHWITLFGKSWDLHVIEGLQTTLTENLAMIADTIKFFRSQGRRVIYDAEHWFDGYKNNPNYALQTLITAAQAGAEWLVFCDTNGGTLPHEVTQIVRDAIQATKDLETPFPLQFGIHSHNDSGTAIGNAIAAVLEGVKMVQGTINGYGERCGNANLCTLIPNFQLKLDYNCIQDEQIKRLTEVSRFVSEVANLAPDDHAPFVGLSAFSHKGGIHVSAVQKNPLTYEHIPPEVIGNQRRIVVSDQAGLSNVLAKARTFGIDLDRNNPASRKILQQLKNLENQGYQFEAAEASFDLLMREALGTRKAFFTLKGFQVHCDKFSDEVCHALATVKVTVNAEDILEAAEGNGPVSALDAALRKALVNFYPMIAEFQLRDYKVRIIDGGSGTSAKTRVLVESSNGQQRWTTVGVSTNIIDASYQAVVEGLEYGLLLKQQETPVSVVAVI